MKTPVSRLERNFCRLLERCENLVSDRKAGEWRLEQYVKDLEERLTELRKINTCQPTKDTLAEYSRKIQFLKGIIEAEKLPSVSEKVIVNQLLSSGSPVNSGKVYQQTKARYFQEMRQELLGTGDDASQVGTSVRLRQSRDSVPQNDIDAVLKYHNSMQEKFAEEMISLVQNLKQNSVMAGHIIRKDTETLEKASMMADSRHGELKVESDRLEVYAKHPCNWGLWIFLGLVCIIFMWMIVFIRLFPKR